MILIFNAGSSSLKAKLYSIDNGELSLAGEKSVSNIKGKNGSGHMRATKEIIGSFAAHRFEIFFIGHRVVLGGEEAIDGEIADKEAITRIKKNIALAPLHNPAALAVIASCKKYIKKAKNCLFYDTSYYNKLPEIESTYPINLRAAKKYGIKRYGYHGISHRYAFEISGADKYKNVLSIHLGAGCSITAIKNSNPIATSMGLTPMGGLIMMTRCGDIDPGVIFYLTGKVGIKIARELLDSESGLSGLTATSGDMLTILARSKQKIEDPAFSYTSKISQKEEKEASLAIEMYCQRVRDLVGAYALRLGGIDAIIFTGKIGAGSSVIREKIMSGLETFNIKEVFCVAPDEETAIAKMLINLVINK